MDKAEKELYDKLCEKQVSREEIFDGRVLHIVNDKVSLPNGVISGREVALHNGAVCIIPITDDGDVILERQYRYPYDEVLWEIPAGKLEPGEFDRKAAAARELREETGYTADSMVSLGEYYGSPAILRERITMYLATGLHQGKRELDADELLEVVKIPLKEAVDMVMDGKIPDGKTQIAILRTYLLSLKKSRQRNF